MNKELILIDLLAEKNMIRSFLNNYLKKRILFLITVSMITSLIFFGFSWLTKLILFDQTSQTIYQLKLNQMYHFSVVIGIYLLCIFILLLLGYILNYLYTIKHFHQFLEKNIESLAHLETLEEDPNYLYFINNQEVKEQPTKRSLLKKSIHTVHLSENERTLIIGQSRSILLFHHVYFLIQPETPVNQIAKKENKTKKIILQSTLILGAFSIILGYLYLTGNLNPKSNQEPNPLIIDTPTESNIQDGDLLVPKNEVQLSEFSELEMNYHYDSNNDLLFQTTNYGKEWVEVPIKASDTRRGDYSLTSGTIPEGYFMDNTYDISPDFSWYLYSPEPAEAERLNLNFLSSTDNGQTWYSHLIGDVFERVRYRKLQRLSSGLMMVIISIPTGTSAEGVSIYDSSDQGNSWHHVADTTLDFPLQNASFISQTLGFLGTRDRLFYTTNGGIIFDESLINIPEDYSSDGIDLFTSPNEVTQKSANTLSVRFNLVKTDKSDIGKMFECEFISTDNGATWNFEKQLQLVHNN